MSPKFLKILQSMFWTWWQYIHIKTGFLVCLRCTCWTIAYTSDSQKRIVSFLPLLTCILQHLCHSCLSHVCFSQWKDTLRKKAGTQASETVLRDEATQQDQPAGGIRAKKPEQYNRIFKEDSRLADHAAQEQHNLATGPKQKTSEGESLFLAAVWTCTCFRQAWKHP